MNANITKPFTMRIGECEVKIIKNKMYVKSKKYLSSEELGKIVKTTTIYLAKEGFFDHIPARTNKQ